MRIKVGMMPGRLVEVEVQEGLTANEIFEKANVEISNHEIRLDGEKISMDTVINNGNLLVAMKMIKGNSDIYVSNCTEEEIEMLLGVRLPKMINIIGVHRPGNNIIEVVINDEVLMIQEDMFDSVYELKSEENIIETSITETNNNNKIEKTLKYEMVALEARHQCLLQEISEISLKKTFLKDLLNKLGM
ncbi:MAG: hypothetical protein IJH34_08085 [Romboutsia sp.]|nr:hypothetical protein [Romboutsia sp.]